MSVNREHIFDLFRGIIIIDMIVIHYIDHFSGTISSFIIKIIAYTDIAIEGFLFVSGYMIGLNYIEKYKRDCVNTTGKIIRKVLVVIKAQYVLIFTASLPVFILVDYSNINPNLIATYLIRSLLFLNQEGLMHILPTFIPLFLLSIPAVWMIRHGLRWYVLGLSLVFFAIGNVEPYLFNVGDKTIFPVILWQVYFFAGMLFGEKNNLSLSGMKKNISKLCFIGIAVFIFSVTVKFADNFIPVLARLTGTGFFRGSKFPLDTLGLLYRGALLVLCYCCVYMSWGWIKKLPFVNNFFSKFGRHSLLAFVIHVYFCFLLKVITIFFGVNYSVAIGVILTNIIFSLYCFHVIDKKRYSE